MSPRFYRHGRVSLQFKSKGGFSIKIDGIEVAGSPDAATYTNTIKSVIEDDNWSDDAKESLKRIDEGAARSLYAEYVLVQI